MLLLVHVLSISSASILILRPDSIPSSDGDSSRTLSARVQCAKPENDPEFGTILTEVTIGHSVANIMQIGDGEGFGKGVRRSARLNNSDLPCLQLFTRYTLCG